jgi:2-polyprenylphenol 6-hydroxylase
MSETQSSNTFDVIVVGAGMVGLSLVAALAPLKLKIAIVDQTAPAEKSTWQGRDPRVSAIVKSSELFLKKTGAWDFITQERFCSFYGMDVWEQDGTANIQFDAADAGEQNLGYIIENRVMQWALQQNIKQYQNVSWFCPQTIGDFKKNKLWHMTLANGLEIQGELLIGADGANSFVREKLGMEVVIKDLGHHAIVCNVQCEKPHQGIARQVFLNSGPLAFLPLEKHETKNYCSIVWSLTPEKAKAMMALDEEKFNQKLTEHFEYRLGEVISSDKRFSFPLLQRHAKSYIGENIALIGDAAHTIHPLAGQGVNLGYMDAQALAEEIERALQRKIPISSREVLRRYERKRRGENTLMMQSMRVFQNVYATNNPDLRLLRNWGLGLTNKSTFLKNFFLKQAMGINNQ